MISNLGVFVGDNVNIGIHCGAMPGTIVKTGAVAMPGTVMVGVVNENVRL